MLIVCLINGNMITPFIKALHDLIDWMEVSEYSLAIIPNLPLNCEPVGSNPWFAFIDGAPAGSRGSFFGKIYLALKN